MTGQNSPGAHFKSIYYHNSFTWYRGHFHCVHIGHLTGPSTILMCLLFAIVSLPLFLLSANDRQVSYFVRRLRDCYYFFRGLCNRAQTHSGAIFDTSLKSGCMFWMLVSGSDTNIQTPDHYRAFEVRSDHDTYRGYYLTPLLATAL